MHMAISGISSTQILPPLFCEPTLIHDSCEWSCSCLAAYLAWLFRLFVLWHNFVIDLTCIVALQVKAVWSKWGWKSPTEEQVTCKWWRFNSKVLSNSFSGPLLSSLAHSSCITFYFSLSSCCGLPRSLLSLICLLCTLNFLTSSFLNCVFHIHLFWSSECLCDLFICLCFTYWIVL